MNKRLPPEGGLPKPSAKMVLRMILGIVALELFFFLFRQGAGWFNSQPLP